MNLFQSNKPVFSPVNGDVASSCRVRYDRARCGGFGLLEALVALVLISSVGFALLAWVQQNLDTLHRLRGHYEEQAARRMVLDWSANLNPMRVPEGEEMLGEFKLKWTSVLEGKVTNQSGYPMGIGLYDVALYRVHISVFRDKESSPWFEEDWVRMGHQKVRDMKLPF